MLNKKKNLSKVKKNRFHSFSEFDQETYLKPRKIRRYHCPDCGKPKAIFKTREEAERFILYNGNDIIDEDGKKPIRAYYCECCNGWHVTHLTNFCCKSRLYTYFVQNASNIKEKNKKLYQREEELRVTDYFIGIRKMAEIIRNRVTSYALDCIDQINEIISMTRNIAIAFNDELEKEKKHIINELYKLKELNFDYLRCVN